MLIEKFWASGEHIFVMSLVYQIIEIIPHDNISLYLTAKWKGEKQLNIQEMGSQFSDI